LLNIAHITDHYSAASGGVAAVIKQLSCSLSSYCDCTEILCVRGNPIPPGPKVHVLNITPLWWAKPWGWNPEIKRHILSLVSRDPKMIFHIHGLWMAPQWITAWTLKSNQKPFLLSPHNMMDEWLWCRNGPWGSLKKNLYWNACSDLFRAAKVVHAITPRERDRLRKFFPDSRIEVIPNVIDLSSVEHGPEISDGEPEPYLLFLSRIHPGKGLELLIRAFSQARLGARWRLVIAGPMASKAYEKEIRDLVRGSGSHQQIDLIGPLFGKEKWSLLRRAWAVVLPSSTEVISMVNLEAGACSTPSITSRETGLDDWEQGGGILTPLDADSLAKILHNVCNWILSERIERGRSSRRLVEQRYSWKTVEPKWLELYRSIG